MRQAGLKRCSERIVEAAVAQSQGMLHSSRRERRDGRNRRKGGSRSRVLEIERERESFVVASSVTFSLPEAKRISDWRLSVDRLIGVLALCSTAFAFLPRLCAGLAAFLRIGSRQLRRRESEQASPLSFPPGELAAQRSFYPCDG